MIIKLDFELEPEYNLHKYIPEHIVKEISRFFSSQS